MRPLKDFYPFFKLILDSCVESYEFNCEPKLTEVFRNQRMMIVINHSTPLSWIPVIGLLTCKSVESFGGDRKPRGIVDRWFYTNPITRRIAEYVTQSTQGLGMQELIEAFHASKQSDLVLFPEGAHAMFGDPGQIRNFRSNKFIEIAVRAQAPILICVHHGSEAWSFPVSLPAQLGLWLTPISNFFSEGIINQRPLNIPFPKARVKKLKMKCILYKPQLSPLDLQSDEKKLAVQLENEAFLVRELMQDELEKLKAGDSPRNLSVT